MSCAGFAAPDSSEEVSTAEVAARSSMGGAGRRLLYVDNLRILMTILIIAHHSAIAYGGPGSWTFIDPGRPSALGEALLALFLAVNPSFFMGFFFLLVAYFTPGAHDRKGAARFLRDRLRRLGILLLVFSPGHLVWRRLGGRAPPGLAGREGAPGNGAIAGLALAPGLLTLPFSCASGCRWARSSTRSASPAAAQSPSASPAPVSRAGIADR